MNPPPGWHPDPADATQLRFWDGQQWTGVTRPLPENPLPSNPVAVTPHVAPLAGDPQAPKKKPKWPWIVGAVVVVFVVIGLVGGGNDSSSSTRSASGGTTTTSSAAPRTQTPEEAEAERQAAEAAAAARRQEQEAAAAAARAEEEARRNPASYETLTDRDFALIAKNPSAATGRRIVLYGNIFQFDSITGTDKFLANTSPAWQDSKYSYDQNTLVVAYDPAILANVVEGDIVKMYVEVAGTYSYDTQIGGSTVVPKVGLRMIEVVG
ncbi:DUF2510 domain-containing protein [Rhodococcus sp. NPDC003382]